MSVTCTRIWSVCNSYVLICHSYVLVSHPYVTHMYSYVICVSLVCTRMPSVCYSYAPVCHPYVLVCHAYVTRMYSYVVWPWIFFSVWLFKVFNIFLVLIILHCLKTCSYIFDFICLSLKREIFKFMAQGCRARVGGGGGGAGARGTSPPLPRNILRQNIFFP